MTFISLLFLAGGLFGQSPDNSTLKGKYHFVQLLMVGSPVGQPLETVNAGGTLIFDGAGGYTVTALRGVGAGAAERIGGGGTYTVFPNAYAELTNPARPEVKLNARIADGAVAIVGSSSEAGDGTCDFFVAVRAPDGVATNGALNGKYTGASLLLPDGELQGLATTFYQFSANGRSFTQISGVGHASDVKNTTLRSAVVTDAAYTMASDGTGEAPAGFFSPLQMLSSFDGQVMLGFSTGAGQRGILVAIRNAAQTAPWQGRFWMNDLLLDNEIGGAVRFTSATGALSSNGTGLASVSQRLNTSEFWREVTAVNAYQTGEDGVGQMGPSLVAGRINFVAGSDFFAGAQVGVEGEPFRLHGLFFGARMWDAALVAGNAASLPPPNSPVAPGSLVTLQGREIDAAGTRVTVNERDTPILGRAAGAVTVRLPLALEGETAVIGVAGVGTVVVPLAASSPGVFSTGGGGVGAAILAHDDGSQVTEGRPAMPGEAVTVSVTGLDPGAEQGASSIVAFVDGIRVPIMEWRENPEVAGAWLVRLRIPVGARTGAAIPLAIGAGNALTCMVEVAVGR